MKIIQEDNFGRETVSDLLVCEKIHNYFGEKIVDLLNDKYGGNDSEWYFRLVSDDYNLYDATDLY